MELTFVGSSADKIFMEAYQNFSLENHFKAEVIFQNNFNWELFNKEYEYLRQLKNLKLSELQNALDKGSAESPLEILNSLRNDVQLKLERYEVAKPIIFILQKKVNQHHS
jgi:hypothetical protein